MLPGVLAHSHDPSSQAAEALLRVPGWSGLIYSKTRPQRGKMKRNDIILYLRVLKSY